MAKPANSGPASEMKYNSAIELSLIRVRIGIAKQSGSANKQIATTRHISTAKRAADVTRIFERSRANDDEEPSLGGDLHILCNGWTKFFIPDKAKEYRSANEANIWH